MSVLLAERLVPGMTPATLDAEVNMQNSELALVPGRSSTAATTTTTTTAATATAVDCRYAALPRGPLDELGSTISKLRFIRKYFAQLEMEYDALCPEDYRDRTASKFAELQACHRTRPSWALNHRLEYLVLEGIPAPLLNQRIPLYRERLRALWGSEAPAQVTSAFDPPALLTATDADEPQRRMFALGMVSEIQCLRVVRSEFEHLRNRLLVSLLLGGACFLYVFWYLVGGDSSPRIPTVPLHVAASGLLGGYFSVLLRLGALKWCPEFAANYHQVDRLFWNFLSSFALAMFEGAVAAFVLYAIFMAGMIEGTIFPAFDAAPFHDPDLSNLFWYSPSHSTDAAKLMVWSIMAGFTERLIPDFLSSFAKKLNGEQADRAAAAKVPVQARA